MEHTALRKFELEMFEMRNQKPLKTYEFYIEFFKDYFLFKVEAVCIEKIDPDDKSLGDEKVSNYFSRKILRKHCTGIELEYVPQTKANNNPSSYYCVTIFHYAATDTQIFFHESQRQKAEEYYEYAFEWMLTYVEK